MAKTATPSAQPRRSTRIRDVRSSIRPSIHPSIHHCPATLQPFLDKGKQKRVRSKSPSIEYHAFVWSSLIRRPRRTSMEWCEACSVFFFFYLSSSQPNQIELDQTKPIQIKPNQPTTDLPSHTDPNRRRRRSPQSRPSPRPAHEISRSNQEESSPEGEEEEERTRSQKTSRQEDNKCSSPNEEKGPRPQEKSPCSQKTRRRFETKTKTKTHHHHRQKSSQIPRPLRRRRRQVLLFLIGPLVRSFFFQQCHHQ